MSKQKPLKSAPVYQRGEFWLDWDQRKDGTRRSPNFTIFWYDRKRGRVCSSSTLTTELDSAKLKLDARYEAAHGRHSAFCPTCGKPMADKEYFVADALTAYWEEVGSKRDSHDSINARIKHLLDWIEEEDRADLMCAAVDDSAVDAFREWSQAAPITIRTKAGIVTRQKQRSPATTEESAHILKAALRHAKDKGRVDHYPDFMTYQRKDVSQKIKTRLSLEMIAKMLAYAAEPNKKRKALHAFLVASVSTIARPDAVFDISTKPSRRQWAPGSFVLSLNPHGRIQTNKHRPDVWTPSQLYKWLEATADDANSGGWLVNYNGEAVSDIGTAWDTMLEALGLPVHAEWKPYLIRRSMATILRNWHRSGGILVDYRELQEQMGHAKQTTTDEYALVNPEATTTVQLALQQVLAKLEQFAPAAFHRSNTGRSPSPLEEAA